MTTEVDCTPQTELHVAWGATLGRDRETAQAVRARLSESGYYYLRTLHCRCHEGKLALRGRLPTYYLKQVAQSLAARVPGVESIVDEIEIAEPERCVAEFRLQSAPRQRAPSA